jgi:hypothetical protein
MIYCVKIRTERVPKRNASLAKAKADIDFEKERADIWLSRA